MDDPLVLDDRYDCLPVDSCRHAGRVRQLQLEVHRQALLAHLVCHRLVHCHNRLGRALDCAGGLARLGQGDPGLPHRPCGALAEVGQNEGGDGTNPGADSVRQVGVPNEHREYLSVHRECGSYHGLLVVGHRRPRQPPGKLVDLACDDFRRLRRRTVFNCSALERVTVYRGDGRDHTRLVDGTVLRHLHLDLRIRRERVHGQLLDL
mmetsp:Transcript_43465/g.125635  ORF Transcript_43465/g.125635 Transcript_43465/m.125635 type:complete len:206 (+) Transcript_43465:1306-1923(+)